MNYIVLENQTLADIATTTYGDVALVFQLLADNPELGSVDAEPTPGQSLAINEALATQRDQRSGQFKLKDVGETVPRMTTHLVKENQTLADVAIEVYGDIGFVFQLMEDNSNLLDLDTELVPGQLLNITTDMASGRNTRIGNFNGEADRTPRISSTMISQGQNLMDIATQVYGSPEGVFQLVQDNPGLSVSSFLEPGDKLVIDTTQVIEKKIVDVLASRNIRVNTSLAALAAGIVGLYSSDGVLLISLDDIILKAADQ